MSYVVAALRRYGVVMKQRTSSSLVTLASPNGFFWVRKGSTVRFIKIPFEVAESKPAFEPLPIRAQTQYDVA